MVNICVTVNATLWYISILVATHSIFLMIIFESKKRVRWTGAKAAINSWLTQTPPSCARIYVRWLGLESTLKKNKKHNAYACQTVYWFLKFFCCCWLFFIVVAVCCCLSLFVVVCCCCWWWWWWWCCCCCCFRLFVLALFCCWSNAKLVICLCLFMLVYACLCLFIYCLVCLFVWLVGWLLSLILLLLLSLLLFDLCTLSPLVSAPIAEDENSARASR